MFFPGIVPFRPFHGRLHSGDRILQPVDHFEDADGVRADKDGQMKWEAHFIVAGENLLVGAMSFNLRPSDDPSGSIKGYRLVTLTR